MYSKNRILGYFLLFSTGVSGMFGLTNCSETPPLKLTLEQRDLVDTIYLKKVQTLGPALDSACEVGWEQRLKEALDSILAVRRAEEEALRVKYANPK